MSTWIGQPGAMIRLSCPSTMTRTGGASYLTVDTVDGGRRAQKVSRLREWAIDMSTATPQDNAVIEQISAGATDATAAVWVAPDAPFANLLTPSDSILAITPRDQYGWDTAGGRTLPDGTWVGGALVASSGASTGPALLGSTIAPVVPGVPVTGSAWVANPDSYVRLSLRNAAGAEVVAARSNGAVGTDVQRLAVTIPADAIPAGVVGAWLTVEGNARFAAAPAITWTGTVYPWTAGRGCAAAVISEAGSIETILAALGTPGWGRYDAAKSVVVTEVSP